VPPGGHIVSHPPRTMSRLPFGALATLTATNSVRALSGFGT
jgi:hypothetical protein